MEINQNTNKLKIGILAVLGVILVVTPIFGYFFYKKTTDNSKQSASDSRNPFTNMYGSETGTQYTKENLEKSQEAMLAELSTLKDSNFYSYLVKNAVYTQSRVSLNITNFRSPAEDRARNFTNIYNDIYDVFQSLDAESANNNLTEENKKFIKARYYFIMSYIYDNSNNQTLRDSKWYSSPDYTLIRNKYSDENLASQYFMLKMSEDTLMENDSLQTALEIKAITRILNFYSKQISKEDLNVLLTKLKASQAKFPSLAQTKMFSSAQYVYIIPSRYYVESLAILAHFDKSISLEQGKKAFQDAFALVDQHSKGPNDVILSIKLYEQFAYISFLFEMNNRKVNQDIIDMLTKIQSYSDGMVANNVNPEIIYLFNGYVKGFAQAKPNDIYRNNILEVSKQNEDFKRYLLKLSTAK